MKFILILAPLFAAVTVLALPADTGTKSTVPTVVLSPYGGNTTLDLRSATDNVSCYNSGTKIDRSYAIDAIDTFCAETYGRVFSDTGGESYGQIHSYPNVQILISLEVINGCIMMVGDNCGTQLRGPIDQCNTSGENGKQGGTLNDGCAIWRADPV